MKKGELSMEVIIIAAIALLVLVILSVLIIRSAGDVGDQTGCEGVGGTCSGEGSCPDGYGRSFQKCSTEGDICCLPATRQTEN